MNICIVGKALNIAQHYDNTSEDSYWENPTQVHSVEKPLGGVLTLSNTRGLILKKSKNTGKAGSLPIMAFTSFDTIEKLIEIRETHWT